MLNFFIGVKIDYLFIFCEDLKCEQERMGDIFINYFVNGERFFLENFVDNVFNVKILSGSD